MNKLINIVLSLRAFINRRMFPRGLYFLFKGSLNPLSGKFGFDRGIPVDRFWIEDFLSKNNKYIKGSVLEITDAKYTLMFGGGRVKHSDVLDIDKNNRNANIYGDLRNLKKQIKDSTYDCIILTHVLGLIDDYEAAIKECRRILKPRGVLLYTGSCLGPILGEEVYWRFTPNSVRYVFSKFFKPSRLNIKSYGNVLSGQGFWVGMSQQDLSKKELEYIDNRYPCAVGAVIQK